jgi:Putative prokaryotic signal transducing protein
MWACPKCRSEVEDTFDICWSCGTSFDGIEDPSFVTADQAEPIQDPVVEDDPKFDDSMDDFAGGPPIPDLVECFSAENTIEAKLIADQLMQQGIPAIADKIDVNMTMGGFQPTLWGYGPKVRVRPEDLERAQAWLRTYDLIRKTRKAEQE